MQRRGQQEQFWFTCITLSPRWHIWMPIGTFLTDAFFHRGNWECLSTLSASSIHSSILYPSASSLCAPLKQRHLTFADIGEHKWKANWTLQDWERPHELEHSRLPQGKQNGKLSSFDLALQDPPKAYSLKNSLTKRNNKCGTGDSIEKIWKSLQIPNKALEGVFLLKTVCKDWSRWLLLQMQRQQCKTLRNMKNQGKMTLYRNTVILE